VSLLPLALPSLKGGKIDMIIDISVAVIALAFVALVIYLIVMIKSLRVTLGQVNQTLVEARKQLGEVGTQAQKVIEQTNHISADLKHKVEAFNPIFNAVNQAGQILEHKATALKKDLLHTQEESFHADLPISGEKKKQTQMKGLMTAAAILELASIGMSLWEKLKKRR
jgi:uncharacterized protein YoxC